jgi:hypothetical protein
MIPNDTDIEGTPEFELLKARVRQLESELVQLRVAAFDFYAMVAGESPSLLEDDINASRLAHALDIVRREEWS